MTFDLNKGIGAITYNHLNLPDSIAVSITNKGNIKYLYDAGGNRLKKTVTDETVTPNKTTTYTYAGDFVYKNDTIEFVSHEEGRLRPQKVDTSQGFAPTNLKYIYDYFLKDHLGNVRSVITTETKTDLYAATLETAAGTKEEQLFSNVGNTRTTRPGGFDTISANVQVSRLHGNIGTGGRVRIIKS